MKNNYYAFSPDAPSIILVFPNRIERDDYVRHENMVAAFIMRPLSEKRAKQMVGQKLNNPVFDITFGCLVVEV